jgi:hypothetical protein
MIDPPTIESEIERTKEWHRGLCENGVREFNPMVFWHSDGQAVVMVFEDTLLMRPSFESAEEKFGRPDWLLQVSDAFVRELPFDADVETEARKVKRGDIPRDFHEGDMSVRECLQLCIAHEGRVQMASIKYVLDDHGMPVYEEPLTHEQTEPNGTVVGDALLWAVRKD